MVGEELGKISPMASESVTYLFIALLSQSGNVVQPAAWKWCSGKEGYAAGTGKVGREGEGSRLTECIS